MPLKDPFDRPKEQAALMKISDNYFHEKHPSQPIIRQSKASWKLTDWIVKYSSLTGNAKLVAASIAANYNKAEGYSRVSYKKIEAMTGLSEATISNAVQQMKMSGEWIIYQLAPELGYHKLQRYIPLAPIASMPGKLMDLTPLAEKIFKREQAKAEKSKLPYLKLDKDFCTIWESSWGGKFLWDFANLLQRGDEKTQILEKISQSEVKVREWWEALLDHPLCSWEANEEDTLEAFLQIHKFLAGDLFIRKNRKDIGNTTTKDTRLIKEEDLPELDIRQKKAVLITSYDYLIYYNVVNWKLNTRKII